jgi:hypothetical protein
MGIHGRKIMISAAALILLLCAAAVTAIMLFPSERIRSLVESAATDAVGMPVYVEHVGLSFRGLPAVSVSGISIGDPHAGEQPLVHIREVRARVALLKLLSRRLEIVSISVGTPSVMIIARADSTTNLPPGAARDTVPAPRSEPPSLPVPVTLGSFSVRGGSVVYDATAVDGTKIVLNDITTGLSLDIAADLGSVTSDGSITVGDIALTSGADGMELTGLNASCSYGMTGNPSAGAFAIERGVIDLNGIAVSLTGTVSDWARIAWALDTGSLELADILDAIPEGATPLLAGVDAGGTVALAVEGLLDGSATEPLTYAGSFSLADGFLAYPGLPKRIDRLGIAATFDTSTITMSAVEAAIGTSQVNMSGTISNYLTDPVLNITADGAVALSDITDAVPMPEGVDATGTVTFDIAAAGSPDDPATLAARGYLDLADIVAELPETLHHPATVNGRLEFDGSAAAISGLSLVSGVSDLTIDGSLTHPFVLAGLGDGQPTLTGTVTSALLDITDLMVADTESQSSVKPWEMEQSISTLPVPPVLAANIDIDLNTVRFGRLEAESTSGTVSLQEGVVSLTDMVVRAYGGSLEGGASVDIADTSAISYDGMFALKALQAAPVLADLLGVKEFISGALSSTLTFSGAGLDSVSMLENLWMDGDMSFTDGAFGNLEFTRRLGEALPFLAHDALAFDRITNTFTVEDQRFITPDMSVATPYGDITVDGWTGFDTSLEYLLTIDLNRDTTRAALESLGGTVASLSNIPDRLELTVGASGTLSDPAFALDTTALQEFITSQIQEKAGEKLEEFLNSGAVNSDDAEKLRDAGKKLLDIFK